MIVDSWHIPKVLYTQYLGVVTGQELIEYALKQSGDSRLDDTSYIIGDWSQVQHTNINTDDVKILMGYLTAVSKICPNARNASIVKRTETGLGLAAWYRHLGESLPWEIAIFHSPKEAFEHYQLDLSQLQTTGSTP